MFCCLKIFSNFKIIHFSRLALKNLCSSEKVLLFSTQYHYCAMPIPSIGKEQEPLHHVFMTIIRSVNPVQDNVEVSCFEYFLNVSVSITLNTVYSQGTILRSQYPMAVNLYISDSFPQFFLPRFLKFSSSIISLHELFLLASLLAFLVYVLAIPFVYSEHLSILVLS